MARLKTIKRNKQNKSPITKALVKYLKKYIHFEPAPWSILRCTIPNIFLPDEDIRYRLLETADNRILSPLNLPYGEWKKLESVGIYDHDSFYDLLSLSLDYFIELHIVPTTFEAVIGQFDLLCKELGVHTEKSNIQVSENIIISESEISPLKDLRIDLFSLPDKLNDMILKTGCLTWSEFSNQTEKDIIAPSGLSINVLKQIQNYWLLKEYIKILSAKVSESKEYSFLLSSNKFKPEQHNIFPDMAKQFISLGCKDEQDMTIMLARLGFLDSGKSTLEELGSLFKLTRERIRQKEQKIVNRLQNHCDVTLMVRFQTAIKDSLKERGGCCFIHELARSLTEKLKWEQYPELETLASFVSLFGGVRLDSDSKLIFDLRRSCIDCEKIVHGLEEIFAKDQSERTYQNVIENLRVYCAKNGENGKCLNTPIFSEGFVYCIAKKTENVLIDDNTIYCSNTWSSKPGTRERLVESVLKTSGRSMHFNEVYRQVSDLLPWDRNVTKRNVHSWLGRCENILLWDRGTFIHCDYIKVPINLVPEIESWLSEKLNRKVPFVSVTGAYDQFKDICCKSNITSETALYTCLRRWGNSRCYYPKYPQIYLKDNFESRIPYVLAVEQFIRDTDSEVSYRSLHDYVCGELYLKEFQFQQCLSNLTNIARTRNGGFKHVDTLNMNIGRFNVLVDYIQQLLNKVGEISSTKIYSEKSVSCSTLGIDSPEMLFSLLRVFCPDKFGLDRYPLIRLNNNGSTTSARGGMISKVSEYIQQKMSPCSFDELETKFVIELGFSEQSVYAVLRLDNIVRFGRGTLVHLDTLEWNDLKQRRLEEQATEMLYQANKVGRCYTRVVDVLELKYDQLPDLPDEITWTPTLLGELLNRSGNFRILGNARNAFVSFPNDKAIENFPELICEILTTKFEGASNFIIFEEYLRNEGIILKSLTSDMLGDRSNIIIVKDLIMLRGLNQDV